jgi:lantibiotic modifying enzyme
VLEAMTPARQDAFLAAAQGIGDRILAERLPAPQGHFSWRGPRGYNTPDNPLRITALGPHLYNGTCGVALFFAALAKVTGSPRPAAIALQTLAPLRNKLRQLLADPPRAAELRMSVGGLSGVGSFIYSFLTIGRLLDEPELLAEAGALTALMTASRIARDDVSRIQQGAAGGLLALLALRRETGEEGGALLELARACGRHLARSRVAYQGHPPAWRISPSLPPVCDFCYGSAGIRYALLQLLAISPDPELAAAAADALEFERSLYCPERRTWKDLRFEGCSIQDMWCHGTAGLALGKIASLPLADDPEIREEIEIALAATLAATTPERFVVNPYDDMCCGHLGRVEVLHSAARLLGRADLLEPAAALAERVLHRAEATGRYGLTSARGTEHFDPSLFQGAAGIGYTLLRLVAPDDLPCLLLMA